MRTTEGGNRSGGEVGVWPPGTSPPAAADGATASGPSATREAGPASSSSSFCVAGLNPAGGSDWIAVDGRLSQLVGRIT